MLGSGIIDKQRSKPLAWIIPIPYKVEHFKDSIRDRLKNVPLVAILLFGTITEIQWNLSKRTPLN